MCDGVCELVSRVEMRADDPSRSILANQISNGLSQEEVGWGEVGKADFAMFVGGTLGGLSFVRGEIVEG